ncbi:alpha/beta-hydrolase, partial [Conidiobolus coronatus NRRL 28638]
FMSYAGAAYCSPNSIINWNCANCKGYASGSTNSVYLSAPAANAAGYLTVNNKNKQIVIAYRGTKDIFNWLYNIIVLYYPARLPYPYLGAQIHFGFYTMANALYEQSKTAVQNAINQHPNYQLVFVGHSLGGAIAEIVAFKLAQDNVINWINTSVYTYGQPRTGDLQFAQYVNSKPWTFTRATSYGDIVLNLPPTALGYAHNQYNMFINKNGKVVKCST